MIRELSRFKNAFLVALIVIVLTSGVVYALTSFTFHGTATVVPSGGGGGGGGVSYDFSVNNNPAGDVALVDADLALGSLLRGAVVTKTVYLKKTGTAPTVNVAVAGTNVSTGLLVGVTSPVTLSDATPVAVPVTITVAGDAPFSSLSYDLTFNLVP